METLLTIKIPSAVLLFSESTDGLLLGIVSYNGIVSTGTCAWPAHIVNDMISDAVNFLFKDIVKNGSMKINNNDRYLINRVFVFCFFLVSPIPGPPVALILMALLL